MDPGPLQLCQAGQAIERSGRQRSDDTCMHVASGSVSSAHAVKENGYYVQPLKLDEV